MFNPIRLASSLGKQFIGVGIVTGALAGVHDRPDLLDLSALLAEETSSANGAEEVYLDAVLHATETVAEPAATLAFDVSQGLPPALVNAALAMGAVAYMGHKLRGGPKEATN